jgi:UDP-N-acetylglucosamine diphosphorylase/glucosamine-1-phosphate N-acetyltransferase
MRSFLFLCVKFFFANIEFNFVKKLSIMMDINTVLFDDLVWEDLLPLTYTRPVPELRIGITTIYEKWQQYSSNLSFKTQEYLQAKYPLKLSSDNIFINAALIPTASLISAIFDLKSNQFIIKDDFLIAFRSAAYDPEFIVLEGERINFTPEIITIENTWDIFEKNDEIIRLDFEALTKGRESQKITATNHIAGKENIFIESGAKIEFATINATEGPVYIGSNAEIMEGALIRGPLALCNNSTIKMGAKIYGATTIGPWCKVGGEIQNSVFTGYSNKGHDGYLGNAVLGEWCNIGADSNNSNLKNNYAEIKLWSYRHEKFIETGLQFCGLIMGDHSKCGINTMFNTGTVVGVSANIFGSGFPRNFIPSFTWGGAAGFTVYAFKKAVETAEIVLGRRKLKLSAIDLKILEHIFSITEKYRK